VEYGEHKLSSNQVVGRTELLPRIWTWHIEQASLAGNFFTLAA
jgi:hypothetical protein